MHNIAGHAFVKKGDVESMASWDVTAKVEKEIAFRTARVLLQDFTGVPAVVDLAAMRDAMEDLGGTPSAIDLNSDSAINQKRLSQVQDVIRHWLDPLRFPQGVRVSIDIDPYSFV